MRIAVLLLVCSLAIGCDDPTRDETSIPTSSANSAAPAVPLVRNPADTYAEADAYAEADTYAEADAYAEADTYAEAGTCGGCHREAQAAWTGSHHDLAMQVAGPETVLGDFDDATFSHHGVTTRFRTQGGRYLVTTEGPDAIAGEFEVAYTFGVEPLQQYLIAFSGGRLQALTIAWDTARARWFSLYPEEVIPAGDLLHWTGPLQRWNTMCADCHSTALVRGYDVATDAYATERVALDVSCQACHGPGAAHVAWAHGLDPKSPVAQAADPQLPVRLKTAVADVEIETCAPCHSRRHAASVRAVPGEPLLDHYAPEGLRPGLYHADGQIDGEVYVYGSFVQSLMHRRGVRCSDCHEPHGLRLRAEGNVLCTRCHASQPDPRFPTLAKRAYDTADHHFHRDGSPGAQCVSCHMPAKTYMGVDERRDHSLRIPRPDLSVSIGTPNACTGCHAERDAGWAADFLAARRGQGSTLPLHFGEALAAGRSGASDAASQLVALVGRAGEPAIARATAVELLAPFGSVAEVATTILAAAGDRDPMLRLAAVQALAALDPSRSVPVLANLVTDERRAVRIEAAQVLAGLPLYGLTPAQRQAFGVALDEYRAVQLALGDTPEAHLNLGIVDLRRGRTARAEDAYRTAIRLRPDFMPVRVNLANLLNAQGRNREAETQLRAALAFHTTLAAGLEDTPHARAERGEIHYSLALLLAEAGRFDEAEQELARSVELLPDRARIRYNRGLALQQLGRRSEAEASLLAAEALAPNDPDIQNALAILYAQAGDQEPALHHAERLVEITGGEAGARERLDRIRGLLGR